MEIHPPEAPIHSVRDFLLHLLMIALGVLLALAAEGVVERVHHHNLVREARENLLAEMNDNHKALQDNFPKMAQNEQQLKSILSYLDKLKTDRKAKIPDMFLNLNMLVLNNASWNAASATGAVALMPYKEVSEFANDYEVQQRANDLSAKLVDYWLAMTALGSDAGKLSASQLEQLEERVQLAQSHLQALENISHSLDREYEKRLSGK